MSGSGHTIRDLRDNGPIDISMESEQVYQSSQNAARNLESQEPPSGPSPARATARDIKLHSALPVKKANKMSDLISRLSASTTSSRAKASHKDMSSVNGKTPDRSSRSFRLIRSRPMSNVDHGPETKIPSRRGTDKRAASTSIDQKSERTGSTSPSLSKPNPKTSTKPEESIGKPRSQPHSDSIEPGKLNSSHRDSPGNSPRNLSRNSSDLDSLLDIRSSGKITPTVNSISRQSNPISPSLEQTQAPSKRYSEISVHSGQPVVVSRPSSRLRNRRPLSISSTTTRTQVNRVEELKSKINELEEVLNQEKAERKAAFGNIERIKELEEQLSKERLSSAELRAKVQQLSLLSPVSSPSDNISSSNVMSRSHLELRIHQLEAKVAELELEADNQILTVQAQDRNNVAEEIGQLQDTVARTHLENDRLRNEKEGFQKIIESLRTEAHVLLSKNQQLLEQLHSANSVVDRLQHEAIIALQLSQSTEKELASSKSLVIKLQDQISLHENELEAVRIERDILNRRAIADRQVTERQISDLERECRRNKRVIAALDASLQDLKISLEEKAMENDELTRSISKVMEQAHDTIEGAKRYSMFMTPVLKDEFQPVNQ